MSSPRTLSRGRRLLWVNKAPEDRAQRAEPENGGGEGLNPKAPAALLGGLRIAGQVKDAASDPDNAEGGGQGIADIDRKQPQRGQEHRHPFQRVHLYAKYPLEVGIARYGRRLDAEFGARLSHLNAGDEVKQDRQAGDECREVIHRRIPLLRTMPS